MSKVSVIVPVYKVEPYIERCVDSIRSQTLSDIEILLVDDGTPDRSGELCDAWAKEDLRIRVIHKENGGLTSAWKAGVDEASSEYVGFVDGDDWVDADMFERLYASASGHDSDMAICGLVYDYEDASREKTTETSRLDREFYDRRAIREELYPKMINNGSFFGRTIQAARVTKLYRTDLVRKNMKYCDNRVSIGEDLQLTFSFLCDAQSISFLPDYYPYHYWINEASMTGKHDPDYMKKIILTKKHVQWIVRVKDVFDFSTQIENDFLILTIMAIRSEIVKNKKAPAREVIRGIRDICQNPEFQKTLKKYDMPVMPLSVRIYLVLIRLHLYPVCYVLGRMFLK